MMSRYAGAVAGCLLLSAAIGLGGCDKKAGAAKEASASKAAKSPPAKAADPGDVEEIDLEMEDLPKGKPITLREVSSKARALVDADGGPLCLDRAFRRHERITVGSPVKGSCLHNRGHARLVSLDDGKTLARMGGVSQASDTLGYLVGHREHDWTNVLVSLADGAVLAPRAPAHVRPRIYLPKGSPYFWVFELDADRNVSYQAFNKPPTAVTKLAFTSSAFPKSPLYTEYDPKRSALVWRTDASDRCGGYIATPDGDGGCLALVDPHSGQTVRRHGDWWIQTRSQPGKILAYPSGGGDPVNPRPKGCSAMVVHHLPSDLTLPRAMFSCRKGNQMDGTFYAWAPGRLWKVPGEGWSTGLTFDAMVDIRKPGTMPLHMDRALLDLRHGKLFEPPDGMRRVSSLLYAKGPDLWLLDHEHAQLRKLAHTDCPGVLSVTLDTPQVQGVACLRRGRSQPVDSDGCTYEAAGSPFRHGYVFDLENGTKQQVPYVPLARTNKRVVLSKTPFLINNTKPCVEKALFTVKRPGAK